MTGGAGENGPCRGDSGEQGTELDIGLPCGSAGEESACHVGDLRSIPRVGRSPGEGNGYPLQYFGASLVAQLVKNLPAVQETWVPSLGWEDPLEKGVATHSSILAWRIPWTVWSVGHKELDTTERSSHSHTQSMSLHKKVCPRFPFPSQLNTWPGSSGPVWMRVGMEEGRVACVRLSVPRASPDQYFQMSPLPASPAGLESSPS